LTEKITITGFCKRCKSPFSVKFYGKKNEQKFCSPVCQVEYHKEEVKKAKAYYKAGKEEGILIEGFNI